MAKYGARKSFWAPWAKETPDTDPNKLPAYGEKKSFGELNKVTDNLNFIEGTLPGDDRRVLYEKRLNGGTVDAESVHIPVADAAEMLGASFDEEMGMAYGDEDEAPYIGYGFLTHHLGKGKHYYQTVFYPMLKAKPTSGSYDTRGDSITFATDKMSFALDVPACGKYKVEKDFSTEAAAEAYLAGLFAGTSAVPGLPAPAAEPAAQAGT